MALKKRLGQLLIEHGLLTEVQLQEALTYQQRTGNRLGKTLVLLGFLTEQEIMEVLRLQLGIDTVNLLKQEPAPEALQEIPEALARRYLVLPVAKNDRVLTVAMADPLNWVAIDDLHLASRCDINILLGTEKEITEAIERCYRLRGANEKVAQKLVGVGEHLFVSDSSGEATVIRVVNAIIQQAVALRASDIHLEPQNGLVRIRYRIDGMLRDMMNLPKNFLNVLVSRIKIMAEMDIAEKRIPQDGRIQMTIDSHSVDLRVASLPTIFGEKIVIRILDKSALLLRLDQLGFRPEALNAYRSMIYRPYGMVLIAGPTGSGKTTTLYATLNEINITEKNIITIEDPVEYVLEGINQISINSKAGLTFSSGLRAILRQDPDIVMIGEIRDAETADTAIRAATSGHLVFSTLHTNDAAGAVTRLLDMGIEPFLVASAVTGVIAQRLVRSICLRCRTVKDFPPDSPERLFLGVPQGPLTLYRGNTCPACDYTGYRGRMAIHEVMNVTPEQQELILTKAPSSEIKKLAIAQGMLTLKDDSIEKILQGLTTTEEVMRVAYADEQF